MSYIDYFTDYTTVSKSLFLGRKIGLIENMRNEFPKVWDLYKQLKSLDWDENEIDISSCRNEFKTLPPEVTNLMIRTLAWQYEADSSASHIAALMMPFVNNTEMMCYLSELAKNELLHSLSYKVIVQNSFDNPEEFLKELVSIKESFQRLDNVNKVFDEIYTLSHKYALGDVTDERQIRKALFKFWVTVYCLERIQFMSSFAVTFGLAEEGDFVPIAKLVQKICTDEFQIHVQGDKVVLTNELAVEENFSIYLECMNELQVIVKEVVDCELNWLEFLFDGKEEIANIRKAKVREFVLYSAADVYKFLKMPNPYPAVTSNPLPYMNKWIVIDNNQTSPQEESVGNYLLGGFIDDSAQEDTEKYALDF